MRSIDLSLHPDLNEDLSYLYLEITPFKSGINLQSESLITHTLGENSSLWLLRDYGFIKDNLGERCKLVALKRYGL